MDRKLGKFEVINSLMMMSIADIVLTSAGILVKEVNSASLLNATLISLLGISITFIMCRLSKNFIGKDLLNISEYLGGKILKTIIGFGFVIYFLLILALFLRQTADAMQLIYYPLTHIIFIIALLSIATGIIASFGNNSIFKTASLIVPFIYFAIFLIFIGNTKNFNIDNMFPILGDGFNQSFIKGLTNIFTFSGLSYLFFFPSKLKKPEEITKIGLIFSILNGIYIIFCVADILFLFSDAVNHSQLPPLYISVRYIEFGTFFQRMDAAFIFLCVLGLISALNINLYFILEILKNITNLSDSKPLIFPCLLTSFGIALGLQQDSTLDFLENSFSKILFIVFTFVVPLIIFIGALIKKNVVVRKG